jgi:hypothetical protein
MESVENLEIMRILDEIYLDHPYYGSRKIRAVLKRDGYAVIISSIGSDHGSNQNLIPSKTELL